MRRKWKCHLALALAGLVCLWGCGSGSEEIEATDKATPNGNAIATAGEPFFADRAQATGLIFTTRNGQEGDYYFCEIAGSGVALLDYDNDGDLDVYFPQGQKLSPRGPLTDAADALKDRLFRNDLTLGSNGTNQIQFVDVTDESGIIATGYGMGAAAGDIDNDGDVDLFVSNYGPNQMWLNNGDGTFTNITDAAGLGDEQWGTSASFFDFDRDGFLDIMVTNYVGFSFGNHRPCGADTGRRDYCGPASYPKQPDKLYRNRGDGTFEDVTAKAGLLTAYGPGLGVVTLDFNGDGWQDIYVANDLAPNQLWMNQGDGTFIDDALLAGAAVNMEGLVEASMGIDAGDVDGDGDDDLFMTHLNGETNTLYLNDGKGQFEDNTVAGGLAANSLAFTGFGTAMLDFDNDGKLDIMAVNGAVYAVDSLARQGDPYPYHQPNQLFQNGGEGVFTDVSQQAGDGLTVSEISRGLAVGDLNNDGRMDALISNAEGPARLLMNQVSNQHNWLGLRLIGQNKARDMFGARVQIRLSDGRSLYRRVRGDASYLSANDPRVLAGLGSADTVESVVVTWPDTAMERFENLSVNAYQTLQQGSGTTVTDVP